ncbi:lysophospholipid acyltransferase family protein [Candidatus Poribacteria bacterium]|nr:lysophospholipid acyltransferase family protein [Candidatus Poribacteria bacterium]
MWRTLKDYCYVFTAKYIGQCIARLPRKLALFIGVYLATVVFLFSHREKAKACKHVAQSLGIGQPMVGRMVRRSFQNIGKNLMEFMQLPCMSPETLHQLVTLEGREHIDKALVQGRGAIILTAHFGNWELLGASILAHGYTIRGITRELRSKRLDAIVSSYREKVGWQGIDRDRSVREVLRCLNRNELIAILADVDTRTRGIFVDFFGQPAYTPYSPVAFALKTGAAILPTFIVRQPDNSHRAIIEAPLTLQQSGEKETDLLVNTQQFTKVIESYIRRYPEQWIWMHERWKTQPE